MMGFVQLRVFRLIDEGMQQQSGSNLVHLCGCFHHHTAYLSEHLIEDLSLYTCSQRLSAFLQLKMLGPVYRRLKLQRALDVEVKRSQELAIALKARHFNRSQHFCLPNSIVRLVANYLPLFDKVRFSRASANFKECDLLSKEGSPDTIARTLLYDWLEREVRKPFSCRTRGFDCIRYLRPKVNRGSEDQWLGSSCFHLGLFWVAGEVPANCSSLHTAILVAEGGCRTVVPLLPHKHLHGSWFITKSKRDCVYQEIDGIWVVDTRQILTMDKEPECAVQFLLHRGTRLTKDLILNRNHPEVKSALNWRN